jgi:hypothetical protein
LAEEEAGAVAGFAAVVVAVGVVAGLAAVVEADKVTHDRGQSVKN